MATYEKIEFKGDYINGRFITNERVDDEFSKKSPSDFKDEVIDIRCNYENVDRAVESAHNAFREWSELDYDVRKKAVLRIRDVFADNQDRIAEVISRETGKPLWESKGEAKAMLAKFDVTLEHSMKLIEEHKIENALPGVDGYIRYKPRGVFVVLGPFNFPGHLPNGHIVPALITGNTLVFKPSELTPATGQLYAELVAKADLPPGVFNMVQGLAETGKKLVDHDRVDGVLFTGSYDVGLKIKEKTMTHYWKMLALEMGGKNAAVVWDDADMNKAIYENLVGCFVTAGQRCSCTSRIILHKKIADQFIDKFYESAKKIKIGHWAEEDVFMGPLIDEGAVEKYIRFQEIGLRENAERLMRGKVLELKNKGNYVTPSIMRVKDFNKKSVYQTNEIFGPNVAFYTVDDFDQAMEINNCTGFGLVTSVFTKNKELYNQAVKRAKVGLVNWNRTTNGASSKLPFGGMGKSGNDRPTAFFAVFYCTVPVASLEDHTEFDPNNQMTGLNYEPL